MLRIASRDHPLLNKLLYQQLVHDFIMRDAQLKMKIRQLQEKLQESESKVRIFRVKFQIGKSRRETL